MLDKLHGWLQDLSLRKSIAMALAVGLTVPVGMSMLTDLVEHQRGMRERLAIDHERIVEVLALGLETPIWEIRPDAAWQLVEAVLLDERVTAIDVTTPVIPKFLTVDLAERRKGQTVKREQPVLHGGRAIGTVRVEMDTGELDALLVGRLGRTLTIGVLQLLIGLSIMFALLRLKVLEPVGRLVEQTEGLASGYLAEPLEWRQRDEIGSLGRSFEATRKALQNLVTHLESRNRELADRESALQRQTQVLRSTFETMSDGITVVDSDLRLVAWNDRFLEVLELPQEVVHEGIPIRELAKFDLERSSADSPASADELSRVVSSYTTGRPNAMRYRTRTGRWLFVRRQPRPSGGFVSTYTDISEQVEAQQAAEQSRQLLEAVMDSAPAMIHVKDRELRFRMVNREFLRYLRRDRDDVLGRTAEELFPKGVSRLTEQRDRMVLATGEASPFQEVPFFGDRAPFTTWATKVPLRDTDGQVRHILTVELDISELKQAQQERERWARLLQDAVESIENGFGVYDAQRRLVLCNAAFATFYDRPAHDLVGRTAAEILTPVAKLTASFDGRPPGTVQSHIERYWAATNPVEVQLVDGRWMMISTHATSEGGLVFVRSDITRLKRMEQDLRASERRFRSIVEGHPIPLVIADVDRKQILYANPSAAHLLQSPVEAIVHRNPADFFVKREDRQSILQMLDNEESFEGVEVEVQLPNGTRIPVAITARHITYGSRNATVCAMVDLTDRKRSEAELVRHREALYQSEKLSALGGLLAGVAHELNNPLSVVVGRAIMLQDELANSPQAKSAERIRAAAERCARIVKTFLAMARQQPTARVPVTLRHVVDAAFEIAGYGLRSHGIEIRVDIPEELPEITADPDQLTQVFTNLFVNAQQAMEQSQSPKQLSVSAHYLPKINAVQVSVTDSGPGIDPTLVARIFEPFFTTKGIGQGTGVGLSVSHGIVQAHGGRIEVRVPQEGGTRFEITLPLEPPRARDIESELGVVEQSRCGRILVVDDEVELAEMLADLLASDGHHVATAGNGREALDALNRETFDLVLSDLRMPDLDGPQLLDEIRSAYPQLTDRVIFITGDTLSETVREFIESGKHTVIEKPFVPDDVRKQVSERLHQLRRV